jgi:hypothetical protein
MDLEKLIEMKRQWFEVWYELEKLQLTLIEQDLERLQQRQRMDRRIRQIAGGRS